MIRSEHEADRVANAVVAGQPVGAIGVAGRTYGAAQMRRL